MPSTQQPIDRPLLAKLLALTASPAEGEALAAMRRATAIVDAAGETWASLLTPEPTGAVAAYVSPQGIRVPQGILLDPPYGMTWRETVRFLVEAGAARCEHDAYVLDRAAVALRSTAEHRRPPITPTTAEALCAIYAAHMGQQVSA